MGMACAGAAITTAGGLATSWSRAGSATCAKQGPTTTGISNADLVTIGSNLPASNLERQLRCCRSRQPPTSYHASSNTTTRRGPTSAHPTQTTGLTSLDGHLRVKRRPVQRHESAGWPSEGRTQNHQRHRGHAVHDVLLRQANSLTSATVSLDGTTNSITGLSSTTWNLVVCD